MKLLIAVILMLSAIALMYYEAWIMSKIWVWYAYEFIPIALPAKFWFGVSFIYRIVDYKHKDSPKQTWLEVVAEVIPQLLNTAFVVSGLLLITYLFQLTF